MLPDSGQVHLAEVLVGGLVRQAERTRGAEEPMYEFIDGVANVLQRSLTGTEALRVLQALGGYIERETGSEPGHRRDAAGRDPARRHHGGVRGRPGGSRQPHRGDGPGTGRRTGRGRTGTATSSPRADIPDIQGRTCELASQAAMVRRQGADRPWTLAVVADTEIILKGLRHLIVAVSHGATSDCYQLFIGSRARLPARLRHARIGTYEGMQIYDGLHDTDLTRELLDAIVADRTVGTLRFCRTLGLRSKLGLTAWCSPASRATPAWCSASPPSSRCFAGLPRGRTRTWKWLGLLSWARRISPSRTAG